jgi:ADP-heptose:LPS heptosyltransferase
MVKKMYPEAELLVLVRRYNYEIVKNLPYVDRIIKIDDYSTEALCAELHSFAPDIFIALYNDAFVARLARASKAKLRIGPLSKLSSFITYNKGLWQKRSKSIKNEGEYNLDLIRRLDRARFDSVYELNTRLYYDASHKEIAELFFAAEDIDGRSLVVNPFIGGSAKNITDSQYSNLLRLFSARQPDVALVLVCHISEKARAEKLIAESQTKVHLYANDGDLLNIAAIIDKGDAFLGASTGPTHIAGALGKRIVAIYPAKKSQSPCRWGVLGNAKVDYIVPDALSPSEDYSLPYFSSYSADTEQALIAALEKALAHETK